MSQINVDSFVKSSNSRRANFVIMRRTNGTLNDCEMQHNAEVGLFTKPSMLTMLTNTRMAHTTLYHMRCQAFFKGAIGPSALKFSRLI